jgi:SAM-dependent methyltransferase
MPFWRTHFGSEEENRRVELERRLRAFYSTVNNYEAYREENWKPEFWAPIRLAIENSLSHRSCKVLEIGAGRTGFANYLGGIRSRVEFHVQDVTGRNNEYLRTVADKVWICDVTQIQESYDVIFSTFVYEHMTAPKAALDYILMMLRPSGSLFIASPRYDFPGYLSPSARHLSRVKRLTIVMELMLRRARVISGGPALFLLHFDPAVFHRPWFRDADAVHWPSIWDLKRFLHERGGAVMERLRIEPEGLRHAFWARFLLLFVRIRLLPTPALPSAQHVSGKASTDQRSDSNWNSGNRECPN